MAVSRAHACMKRLTVPLSKLVEKKARLALRRSSFTRWISVESGRCRDFADDELSKGKRFAAVWGNGDFGRLGLGNLESQWSPKPILPSSFNHQSLKEIACGGAHTLFLTENGEVYATGLNDFGQLGISDSQNYTTEPLRVSSIPKRIVKISAGYHHSAAITVDGELYVWGKNVNGQLGLGKKAEKIIPLPCKVHCLDGFVIKMISLGFEHSIAVTDKGEALSWGGGESGRLGHGHESSILGFQKSSSEYTPRLIKGLEGVKVKNVSAGMLHSACICENGSVYFFGERELGKWGFGKVKSATTPSIISTLPFSEEVACGGYHTCVITNDGELYTWGSNENGCLGIGCTDVAYSPERVQGQFLRQPVSKVSCGWKHTAAISGGNVYTWGWGGSNGTFKEDGHSPGGQVKVTMLTTLNQCWSTFTRMSNHYKYLADLIILLEYSTVSDRGLTSRLLRKSTTVLLNHLKVHQDLHSLLMQLKRTPGWSRIQLRSVESFFSGNLLQIELSTCSYKITERSSGLF